MSNSIPFAVDRSLPFKKKNMVHFAHPRIITNNQKTPYPTGKPTEYATYDYQVAYPYNDPYSYQNAYQKTFVSSNKKKEKRRKKVYCTEPNESIEHLKNIYKIPYQNKTFLFSILLHR
jgi:hypothetical protein